MSDSIVETEDTTKRLLELAASDDVAGFRQFIEHGFANNINIVGQWYGEKDESKLVPLLRTPLMVASTHGSIEVVKFIISFPNADLNKICGNEKTTALHCAASGGSLNSVDIVKLLLGAGADPNLEDAHGNFPIDVIVVPENFDNLKTSLEELLKIDNSKISNPVSNSNSNSPPLSPENGSPISNSNSSSDSVKISEAIDNAPFVSEKKEYPIDPNFPGITSGIYLTDEFRMYSFKVKPCCRAYSHDWTDCPFVHPGENARRRDPRKYHYSCTQCPDFKKGGCRRGDMCEYAHGVFESWLHPAQYRTRICKDGPNCNRRVCFFAHNQNELRPLYAAVQSPRSDSGICVFPDSPSSPFTPPTSPTVSMIASRNWAMQKVPSLHLPVSNFQISRLRSSLNARDLDMDPEELEQLAEFDREHLEYLNEIARLAQPSPRLNKLNLDDVFAAESSSPRQLFSPVHKSAFLNQFQQHKNMLSPINTDFSPRSVERPLVMSPLAARPSPGRNSPQRMGPISPMAPRSSMLRDMQAVNFRSLSSRDLGSSSAAVGGLRGDPWANFGGNPSGEAVFNANDFQLNNNLDEPDIEWVDSLVKDTPNEMQRNNQVMQGPGPSGEGSSSNQVFDPSALAAWLDQIQLNQLFTNNQK